jgi:DNA-binding MarR family transcriptional regulator
MSPSLELCIRLAKAHAAVVRRFDSRLGALHGLSFGDFQILLDLSRALAGKLRRVDLAAELGVTPSAVTRSLIPLERIGLVKRQHDAHDARVGYALLTKAGQRLLEESLKTAEVASADAIPSSQAPQLQALLDILADLPPAAESRQAKTKRTA